MHGILGREGLRTAFKVGDMVEVVELSVAGFNHIGKTGKVASVEEKTLCIKGISGVFPISSIRLLPPEPQMMICPQAKTCGIASSCGCESSEKHVHREDCDKNLGLCPACILYVEPAKEPAAEKMVDVYPLYRKLRNESVADDYFGDTVWKFPLSKLQAIVKEYLEG